MPDNTNAHVQSEGADLAVSSVSELKEALLDQMSVMDILGALTEGLYRSYGHLDPDARPAAVERRWSMLLDLMYHFEMPKTEGPLPSYEPLSLIALLEEEGILPADDCQYLRDDFNAQARGVAGPDGKISLDDPEILQGFYTLLTQYRFQDRLTAREQQNQQADDTKSAAPKHGPQP